MADSLHQEKGVQGPEPVQGVPFLPFSTRSSLCRLALDVWIGKSEELEADQRCCRKAQVPGAQKSQARRTGRSSPGPVPRSTERKRRVRGAAALFSLPFAL